MPNLKDLKNRISSVKSTQKITSAMKMVAAAKLRRAQELAEAARPYAERISHVTTSVGSNFFDITGAPPMLVGKSTDNVHLLIVCTADRGLCGAFNGSIIRATRRLIKELEANDKVVKILCIGRKGRDNLNRDLAENIVDTFEGIGKLGVKYIDAQNVTNKITDMFDAGEFDVCTLVYNKFESAMTQVVTPQKIIPLQAASSAEKTEVLPKIEDSIYIFEPNEEEILLELLPHNLSIQIFQALLESAASEHGARMTAMDSASRNAGDMIDGLTLTYNRTRQAAITKELIEIISGAEAL